ncbi:hypothetical protein ISN74_19850 [Dyella caseinilytica]|uniref:Uncharacterized protein n=1 Tax=Dyella caseinilytica TaxID=1849581 RepID=A0ABX7GUD6_9GAMM|nr:hypothetical protein ISN74_19850 [Dyella caseinilytica]
MKRFTERDRLPEPIGVITKLFPWHLYGNSLSKAFGWIDRWVRGRLNHVIKISSALSRRVHRFVAKDSDGYLEQRKFNE